MRKRILKRMTLALLAVLFCTSWSYAQKTVTGTVTDGITKQAMPGVNVMVKGTLTGTVTNHDGQYSIKTTSDNDKLVFTFIGYDITEVEVGVSSSHDVAMSETVTDLNEVVVIGYGTQKKSDLTGSVGIVSIKDMKKASNSNMGTLLQGRIAGVSVTSDGQPGADPTIRIRGIGTFGDASPLYVIDGVPVGTSARDFSPSDIESMQVLKDASAAAIYGSRAANGVIIITTKHGANKTPLKVRYNGYFGFDNLAKEIPVLGRTDYQMMANRSRTNYGVDVFSANDPTSTDYISDVNTNWLKEGLKTGIRQDHSVDMYGGGDNSTYNVSLDYFNSRGMLVGHGPDYDRYTARVNNTAERGFFKFGSSVVYSHSNQNDLNSTDNSSFSGGNPPIIVKLLGSIPTMSVYDAGNTTTDGFGTYNATTQGEMYSLNIVAINSLLQQSVQVDRMFANGFTELDLGKLLELNNQSLKYKLNVSWDRTQCLDSYFIPAFELSSFYTNKVAKLSKANRKYTTALVENTLNYSFTFGESKIDALVGQMYQTGDYSKIYAYAEGFSKPYYTEITNGETTSASSYDSQHYMASYLGRINYDYGDRYLLTGTIRRDGSSRFSTANRYGYFPSVALGWKINHEKFFPVDEHIVSEFKLRGSWGQLGNENIDDYSYLQTINRGGYVYNFNNEVAYGSTESSVVDTKLKWETKTMSNVGIDLSLLDRAIDFTVEYYNSRSTDLLVSNAQIPYTVGSIDNTPTINAGKMENKGIEFSTAYHNHKGEFKYDISANVATLKNKVISLGNNGQPVYGVGSRSIEGQEVGRHYGYVYDKIFQTQSEIDALNANAVAKNGSGTVYQSTATGPGDIKFKDLDGDGKITSTDRTDLGSAIPDLTYGFNFAASYKNFDISMFATGATGFLIYDNLYRNLMHTTGVLNWHKDILNSWTPTNTNTNIPRVDYTDSNDNDRNSNRPGWLQDGTYLKIATISLGYTLPNTVFTNVISNARVYVTCQNVYTFSKYKGYNPDYSSSDVWSPGYNSGSFPTPRTFMVGLNVDFK